MRLVIAILNLMVASQVLGDAVVTARTMAWIKLAHPLTNDLTIAGLECCKLSYNFVYGDYLLDLQSTSLTNLDALARILKQHDFTAPPAQESYGDKERLWGPAHRGPCSLGINLCGTQVTNMAPLQGLPISLLWLANTPFCDTSSLAGLPIRSLNIQNTKVRDVEPLCKLSLEELFFDPLAVTNGLDRLRGAKTLKRIQRFSRDGFWEWYDQVRPQAKERAEKSAAPLPAAQRSGPSEGAH